MSGFDNGSLQGGIFAQAKQFGSILRGYGPPVPQAGVVGDLFLDTQAWGLYEKRSPDAGGDVDPWGHYLFVVPVTYRTTLKWFSGSAPGNDVGAAGDYCLLWGGFNNYGLQPSICGPKQASGWPENGEGAGTTILAAGAGTVLPLGLLDEGATVAESSSTQLLRLGLLDEAIIPIAVTLAAGQPVLQLGLQSGPALVAVSLNPLYTAEDTNAAVPVTARLPAAAANVPILVTDIEVGIDTAAAATVCVLPSVAAWATANVSGFDLTIFDYTGHGLANNVTFSLNGTDVFAQGVAPVIQNNYAEVRLRPIVTGGINKWFVKAVG